MPQAFRSATFRSIGAPGPSHSTLPPLGRPAETPRSASQLASAQPRIGRCCTGVGAAGASGSRAPAAFAVTTPSTSSTAVRRQFGASHGSSVYGSSGYGASYGACRAASPSICAGAGAPLGSPRTRARAGHRAAAPRSEPRPELVRPSESSSGRPAAQAPEPRPELPDEPSGKGVTCDKCDGRHATDGCPSFNKARENHPDARSSPGRKSLGDDPGRAEVLSGASVVRQPADGSCLFHSICHGLCDGTTAPALRRQVRCIKLPSFCGVKISTGHTHTHTTAEQTKLLWCGSQSHFRISSLCVCARVPFVL